MSTSAAGHWVKFFNASGIPSPAAATYAHIFVENRIQNDMLMDINKEYLREMGIKPMGDIIAILRHAKTVSDQTAREKVLRSDGSTSVVPIAAVPANPISNLAEKSTKTIKLKSAASAVVAPLPKPARRVLPEHEGKYKIKLPEGNTERSKEILAKKAKMYADREAQGNKTCVFERLTKNGKDEPVSVRITGISTKREIVSADSSTMNSIFSRLGNKAEGATITKQIKPILKNTSKASVTTGVVKAKSVVMSSSSTSSSSSKSAVTKVSCPQKVILVKKVPLKTNDTDEEDDEDMESDDDFGLDYDDTMSDDNNIKSTGEKIVKFASTAEVREIVPDPVYPKTKGQSGIKARLGLTAKLHSIKRSYNMKPTTTGLKNRVSPVKGKTLRMKADEMLLNKELPVHKRLGMMNLNNKGNANTKRSESSIPPSKTSRLSSSNSSSRRSFSGSASNKMKSNKSSVFDRLSL